MENTKKEIQEEHIELAENLLCYNDDLGMESIKKQIELIIGTNKTEPSKMIDEIDEVIVWEKREHTTTCQEFLKEIKFHKYFIDEMARYKELLDVLDESLYDELSDYSRGAKDILNVLLGREETTNEELIKEIKYTNHKFGG